MADQPGTFEIGLAMAGAISAGAYSSGVVDFLFQALDAWEQEKRRAPGSVPNHRVCIKVITGASAGSITGALGAVALAGGLQPNPDPSAKPSGQPYLYTVPSLYTAWVEMPDLALHAGQPDLLGTTDLDNNAPVRSLLDSSVLDKIGERALGMIRGTPSAVPPVFGPLRGGDRIPYLADPLHLYMTISNLRGVPYKITFENAEEIRGHGMLNHGDRTHFIISGIGGRALASPWASSDSGSDISVDTLPAAVSRLPEQWHNYLQAALASSAFPVGLAPRLIAASTTGYKGRMWPFPHDTSHSIEPDWPSEWKLPKDYSFVNVDGGVINNEPFEYAHFALMEAGRPAEVAVDDAGNARTAVVAGPIPLLSNQRGAKDADRAVILIDPFPEDPTFLDDSAALDGTLIAAIKALLPTFISQARFKPSELALALDEKVYSRFLIAPRRTNAAGGLERYTIATGLLSGFGGFCDRSLREFDYQLGRRNCQKFLRDAFSLHPDNALIAGWPDEAKRNPQFHPREKNPGHGTIIPLVGSAQAEVPLPDWPKLSDARVNAIADKAVTRATRLIPQLIEQQTKSRLVRRAAQLLWKFLGAEAIRDFVYLTIQKELIQRDQHAAWSLASHEERSVLAALSDPGYDFRTIIGLTKSTGIAADRITQILANAEHHQRIHSQPAPDGTPAYTLMSRKPGWFAAKFGDWFNKPSFG